MFNRQIIKFGFSKQNKVEKFIPRPPAKNEPAPSYPKQHPIKIHSNDSEILTLNKFPKYMTPHHQVPSVLFKDPALPFESPVGARFLEVGIVGAPNAGKSSLFNHLIGKGISSVSNKSNTTNKDIHGIYTNIESKTQILFHDTPGITRRFQGTSQYTTIAWETLGDCDKVLLVVDSLKRLDDPLREVIQRLKRLPYSDADKKKIRSLRGVKDSKTLKNLKPSEPEEGVTQAYESTHIPTYLILNKIDLCSNKRKLKSLVGELEDLGKFEKIYYTSAETRYGVDNLIKSLEAESYLGPWEHHPDVKTNLSDVRRFEQIMKGIVFGRFYYEVPYSIGIRMTSKLSSCNMLYNICIGFSVRTDGVVRIEYALDTITANQVAMVVGKRGRNLKLMRDQAEAELAKIYQKHFIVSIKVLNRSSEFWLKEDVYDIRGIYDEKFSEEQAVNELEAYKAQIRQKIREEHEK